MGKIRKKWSDSQLEAALADAKLGIPLGVVSKSHCIPRATLISKIKGWRPIGKLSGPSTVLSTEEEAEIVKWMLYLSKRGFPVTKKHIINNVTHLVQNLKKETPFTNGRPGRHWCDGFLRRHPDLATRVVHNFPKSRSAVTEEALRRWFGEVREYLDEKGLTNIDGHRIFNCEESAFYLCPKEGHVLVKKGDKAVYNFTPNDDKECLTVLFMTNACGALPPPMTVFSYDRIPYSIAQSMPDDWSIGKSANGWMTAETFYEYISNVFEPWLTKQNIERPVILYVDGHTSHMTIPLAEFCSQKDIELIALYPNATYFIQPLDVALLDPLKDAWQTCINDWRTKNQREITKEDFGLLLKQAVDMIDLPMVMSNGFRKTGLYPFSADVFNYEILKKGKDNIKDVSPPVPSCSQNDVENHMDFFEANIGRHFLDDYKELHKPEIRTENNENKALFPLWQKAIELSNCLDVPNGVPEVFRKSPFWSNSNNFTSVATAAAWKQYYEKEMEKEHTQIEMNEKKRKREKLADENVKILKETEEEKDKLIEEKNTTKSKTCIRKESEKGSNAGS